MKFAAAIAFLAATGASSQARAQDFPFLPSQPSSEFLPVSDSGPDHGFCSKWDPEYGFKGKACCERVPTFKRRAAATCSPQRIKWSFCDEMTADQRDYLGRAERGELGAWWEQRSSFQQSRAYCSVSHGFLVNGRPLVGTSENRILIRNANRCTNFGTDGMVGALEWLGREIHREYADPSYSGVRLNVGDLSAPRGGCISGRRGRRGHKSHTTGVDADIGFLNLRAGTRELNAFATQFDAKANLWLLKRLFSNPHACVKAVFVDRRMISKLAKAAGRDDAEWQRIRPYVKHIRGHRAHFHIRVGERPGAPGCGGGFDAEEDEFEGDGLIPESGSDSELPSPQSVQGEGSGVGRWSASAEGFSSQDRLKSSASQTLRSED